MTANKILIVEDDPVIADDLAYHIGRLGYGIVGPAGSLPEGKKLVKSVEADLALLDIHLDQRNDGIELARWLRKHHPMPIIFLTAFADELTIARAKKVHPDHYLLKPFQPHQIRVAIEIASNNFHSPSPASKVRSKLQKLNHQLPTPLTSREKEIVLLVSEGLRNREMAKKLFISENTIKSHLKNIYCKADVCSRSELLNMLLHS